MSGPTAPAGSPFSTPYFSPAAEEEDFPLLVKVAICALPALVALGLYLVSYPIAAGCAFIVSLGLTILLVVDALSGLSPEERENLRAEYQDKTNRFNQEWKEQTQQLHRGIEEIFLRGVQADIQSVAQEVDPWMRTFARSCQETFAQLTQKQEQRWKELPRLDSKIEENEIQRACELLELEKNHFIQRHYRHMTPAEQNEADRALFTPMDAALARCRERGRKGEIAKALEERVKMRVGELLKRQEKKWTEADSSSKGQLKEIHKLELETLQMRINEAKTQYDLPDSYFPSINLFMAEAWLAYTAMVSF